MQEVRMLVRDEKKYHDFSNWAVTRLGLQPQNLSAMAVGMVKQRSDISRYGIQRKEKQLTQEYLLKSRAVNPLLNQVKSFCRTMDKHNAIGVFITIEPVSSGMRQEAADMGTFSHNNETFPKLQFWQIDDTFFENPSSLRSHIRLPKQWLEPMRKMERHFTDTQMSLNISEHVD